MTSQQTGAHTSFYEQLHRRGSISQSVHLQEGCSTGKHSLSRNNLCFIAFNNHNFYLSLYTSSDIINSFCSADLLSISLFLQFSLILSFFRHNSHSSAIHLWPCIFYCTLSTLPSFPSLFYPFVYLTKLYPFSPFLSVLSFFLFLLPTFIHSRLSFISPPVISISLFPLNCLTTYQNIPPSLCFPIIAKLSSLLCFPFLRSVSPKFPSQSLF